MKHCKVIHVDTLSIFLNLTNVKSNKINQSTYSKATYPHTLQIETLLRAFMICIKDVLGLSVIVKGVIAMP